MKNNPVKKILYTTLIAATCTLLHAAGTVSSFPNRRP